MKINCILESRMLTNMFKKEFDSLDIEYNFYDLLDHDIENVELNSDILLIQSEDLNGNACSDETELLLDKLIDSAMLPVMMSFDKDMNFVTSFDKVCSPLHVNDIKNIDKFLGNVFTIYEWRYGNYHIDQNMYNLDKLIMIASSDLDVHAKIRSLLIGYEYEFIHVISENETLELLNKITPFLIIVDTNLIRTGTKNVVNKIKHNAGYKYSKLMLLTESDEEFESYDSFGVDDFVEKPINSETLISRIEEQNIIYNNNDKILIVEDGKFIRKMLTSSISNSGYPVYTAKNGLEGLEIAKMIIPDIIITDYEMPLMDGFEMIRQLKKINELSDCKYVMMSSYESKYHFSMSRDLGIEKYFVKPFNTDQIILEIERILIRKYKNTKIENQYMLLSIESLVKALEARDKYTIGHTERVTDYAVKLCRYMEMEDKYLERIKLAARLHDIGKIGIRDDILLKEGPLTVEEFDTIKTHPHKGVEILKPIKSLKHLLPLINSHHERWDGNGYPGGLKEIEIPLGARIISIADSFDAITSDRPYRNKKTIQEALDILSENSGTQFCPRCVEAFVEMFNCKNGKLCEMRGANNGETFKKIKNEIKTVNDLHSCRFDSFTCSKYMAVD